MIRLADLMRRQDGMINGSTDVELAFDGKPISALIKDENTFIADNVRRYHDERLLAGEPALREGLCLMPPFDVTWIEYGDQGVIFGALVFLINKPEFTESNLNERMVKLLEEHDGNAKHLIEVCPFYYPDQYGGTIGPIGTFLSIIDSSGNALPAFDWKCNLKNASEKFSRTTLLALRPILLTLAFLNCKNVKHGSAKIDGFHSRKHKQKHGVPLVKYKTLNIEPMKTILDRDGHAASNGIANALHICRGHFKTYTETKPLFGKVTGRFWWPSVVRGNEANGIVRKNYNVKV